MSVLFQLMAVFFKIGFFTIGGGLAMLPLIRSEMLAHGWMSETEFLDILAVSEITPGPMAINTATFVGFRVGGVAGALVATLALVLPALLMVCLLGAVWRRTRNAPASVRVLALLRPVVAGLVLAAALGLVAACVLPVRIGAGGFDTRTVEWRALVVFAGVGGATWHYRINPLLGMAGGALAGFVLYSL
ncbi:MAG: chromate transporter [Lentisphaerae bacterium]|nr:chromate transporter [Lentisphaerota bacterium]